VSIEAATAALTASETNILIELRRLHELRAANPVLPETAPLARTRTALLNKLAANEAQLNAIATQLTLQKAALQHDVVVIDALAAIKLAVAAIQTHLKTHKVTVDGLKDVQLELEGMHGKLNELASALGGVVDDEEEKEDEVTMEDSVAEEKPLNGVQLVQFPLLSGDQMRGGAPLMTQAYSVQVPN